MSRTAAAPTFHAPVAADWVTEAACRGSSEEFVVDGRVTAGLLRELAVRAHRYCAGCPVLRECAERADQTRAEGVWAGALRSTDVRRYTVRPLIAEAVRPRSVAPHVRGGAR